MLNKEYIVTINNEDLYGNGIAKIDNKVVFIKGVFVGEKIKIKIINNRKRFMIGELIEIIVSSSRRAEISCPYFYKCGGCDYLHLNNNNENKLKKEYVCNFLKEYKINKFIFSSSSNNYRNKVVLHVQNDKLGLYEESTNSLIEVENCVLLDNDINTTIRLLKDISLKEINEIIIRKIDNKIMIQFISNNFNIDYKRIINELIESIYINNKLVYGNEYLIESFDNIKYAIYPDAFFQVNICGMKDIYNIVKSYINKNDKVLDLYCGVGSISLYISDLASSVLGVEVNNDAIKSANLNKKLNKITNVNFLLGDASIVSKTNFDAIIVDPPRSGLSKKVIFNLNNSKCNKIIYVSCNPITFKRDIGLLHNYCVTAINVVDMFPKTKHVECVSVLHRKSVKK